MAPKPPVDRFLLEITKDGNIILATTRATAVIGYTMKELTSRNLFDLISPDVAEDFQKKLQELMKSPMPFERLKTKMVGMNGDLVYVEISGIRIIYRDQPIFQLTVQDISNVVHAELEMKRAREESELFLDLMTHDIANLNQIGMGYIELALDTLPLDAAGRELLKKPLDVFKSTTRLIQNVKKLRAARHGTGLKIERVDLGKVLRSLENESLAVPGREITVNYHYGRNCQVMANELIREVFVNLIGNAIKHSPDNKPLTIDVRLDRTRMGDIDYCRITVEDNGSGMPDALKEKLMNRTNEPGGFRTSGIGLVLIMTLIEDYRGKFLIEDRVPGDYRQGARIVVMLPVAPVSVDQVRPAP